jgi:hypothetical protein
MIELRDIPAASSIGPVLPERLPDGWRLRARCLAGGCGATAWLDAGPWIALGLAGTRLERLETRLRCRCGARQARLDIRHAEACAEPRPAIYAFR